MFKTESLTWHAGKVVLFVDAYWLLFFLFFLRCVEDFLLEELDCPAGLKQTERNTCSFVLLHSRHFLAVSSTWNFLTPGICSNHRDTPRSQARNSNLYNPGRDMSNLLERDRAPRGDDPVWPLPAASFVALRRFTARNNFRMKSVTFPNKCGLCSSSAHCRQLCAVSALPRGSVSGCAAENEPFWIIMPLARDPPSPPNCSA